MKHEGWFLHGSADLRGCTTLSLALLILIIINLEFDEKIANLQSKTNIIHVAFMNAPTLYIIAGCNGAGKTTASYSVLPVLLNCKE